MISVDVEGEIMSKIVMWKNTFLQAIFKELFDKLHVTRTPNNKGLHFFY
jgi:hypothetical protein